MSHVAFLLLSTVLLPLVAPFECDIVELADTITQASNGIQRTRFMQNPKLDTPVELQQLSPFRKMVNGPNVVVAKAPPKSDVVNCENDTLSDCVLHIVQGIPDCILHSISNCTIDKLLDTHVVIVSNSTISSVSDCYIESIEHSFVTNITNSVVDTLQYTTVSNSITSSQFVSVLQSSIKTISTSNVTSVRESVVEILDETNVCNVTETSVDSILSSAVWSFITDSTIGSMSKTVVGIISNSSVTSVEEGRLKIVEDSNFGKVHNSSLSYDMTSSRVDILSASHLARVASTDFGDVYASYVEIFEGSRCHGTVSDTRLSRISGCAVPELNNSTIGFIGDSSFIGSITSCDVDGIYRSSVDTIRDSTIYEIIKCNVTQLYNSSVEIIENCTVDSFSSSVVVSLCRSKLDLASSSCFTYVYDNTVFGTVNESSVYQLYDSSVITVSDTDIACCSGCSLRDTFNSQVHCNSSCSDLWNFCNLTIFPTDVNCKKEHDDGDSGARESVLPSAVLLVFVLVIGVL